MKGYKNDFAIGLKDGVPIALGYLTVSFSFGASAAVMGFTPLFSIILSLTNLTSAGQFAGTNLFAAGAMMIEIAITVFIINIRYMLMSISLTQKIDPKMPMWKRLIISYGITDEIFAVSSTRNTALSFAYMMGLILLPTIGWTAGAGLGAVAVSVMPEILQKSFAIALYGMFIAIIIPEARTSKAVLCVAGIAVALSCAFYYIPFLNEVPSGFAMIISAIAAAAIGAAVWPVKEEQHG